MVPFPFPLTLTTCRNLSVDKPRYGKFKSRYISRQGNTIQYLSQASMTNNIYDPTSSDPTRDSTKLTPELHDKPVPISSQFWRYDLR